MTPEEWLMRISLTLDQCNMRMATIERGTQEMKERLDRVQKLVGELGKALGSSGGSGHK